METTISPDQTVTKEQHDAGLRPGMTVVTEDVRITPSFDSSYAEGTDLARKIDQMKWVSGHLHDDLLARFQGRFGYDKPGLRRRIDDPETGHIYAVRVFSVARGGQPRWVVGMAEQLGEVVEVKGPDGQVIDRIFPEYQLDKALAFKNAEDAITFFHSLVSTWRRYIEVKQPVLDELDADWDTDLDDPHSVYSLDVEDELDLL